MEEARRRSREAGIPESGQLALEIGTPDLTDIGHLAAMLPAKLGKKGSRAAEGAREPWQMTRGEFNEATTHTRMIREVEAYRGTGAISSESVDALPSGKSRDGARFVESGFRDAETGVTYRTGGIHNPELLPSEVLIGEGIGKPSLEAGFFDKQGRFFTRAEAAQSPPSIISEGSGRTHRKSVEHALAEGKPVPPEVRAEYPDLAAAATRAEAPTPRAAEGAATATARSAVTELSVEDAVATIRERVRRGDRAGWFRNADKNYKGRLVRAVEEDPKVRAAALRIFHDQYQKGTGSTLSFQEFLDTPITLYRGGKAVPRDEPFASFSYSKETAQKFAPDGKTVEEITVRPRETLGMMQTTAEGEVLIPTPRTQEPAPVDMNGSELVDLDGTPVPVNTDGTITVYHRTSAENAARIEESGRFVSEENTGEAFFSTRRDGQATGYGDAVVELRLDPSTVRIDDAFHGGEVHLAADAVSVRAAPTPSAAGSTLATSLPIKGKQ